MAYNSQFDLRGKRIENTYTQVVQYDTSSGYSYTGQGEQLTLSSSFTDTSISSSFAEQANTAFNATNSFNANISVSSSYALTSSYALNGGSGTTLITASTYQITSSWSNRAISASWIPSSNFSISASWASQSLSASWSPIQLPNITDDIITNRVGINVTNPQSTLDVSGSILLTGYIINTGSASDDSNFIGLNAGYNSNNSVGSNFIGYTAGALASNSGGSNFIGYTAGATASNSNNSNFIGTNAGRNASNTIHSIFIGTESGDSASGSSYSNFIGYNAGYQAYNAIISNFVGANAGYQAYNANNSIFIGAYAGYYDTVNNSSGNSSILIGDYTSTGGNSDSIAIGKGTQNNLANQLNLGNVIYATNIYSNSITSSSPTINGKVGIGINNPINTLDVVGNISCSIITASLLNGTSSYARQASSASHIPYTNITIFNTQIGGLAGQNAVLVSNITQIGAGAGQNSTTASNATQIGSGAGQNATNAYYTTQVGLDAGEFSTNADYATQIGTNAGRYAQSGSFSTFIGCNADTLNINLNVNKSIGIGYNAKVSGSNQCAIGGTGVDAVNVSIGGNYANNTLDVVGNISCSVITASLINTVSSSLAPLNQTTASAWMPIIVNEQTFYIPLYQ